MLPRWSLQRLAFVIAAVHVLVMALLPWSHAKTAATGPNAGLAAYAMPDGTLPMICGHGGGETDPSSPLMAGSICPACLLHHGAGLPPVEIAQATPPVQVRVPPERPRRPAVSLGTTAGERPPARAPPRFA